MRPKECNPFTEYVMKWLTYILFLQYHAINFYSVCCHETILPYGCHSCDAAVFSDCYNVDNAPLQNALINLLSYMTGERHPYSKVHGTKWGLSGADRTQLSPVLAPWALLSGMRTRPSCHNCLPSIPPVFLEILQMERHLWDVLF